MAKLQSGEPQFNMTPIMDPARLPCRGMRSWPTPAALPSGYFAQLTNLRFDKGNLYCRSGHQSINLTPPAGITITSMLGSWMGYINGTEYIVMAVRTTTPDTRIFSLAAPFSSSVWAEVTGGSGKYGNTRFATSAQVSFACVRDPASASEVLVIQDLADSPIVWDPAASTCATAVQSPTPSGGGSIAYVGDGGIASGVAISAYSVSSAAHLTGATGTSPYGTLMQMTVASGITASEAVYYDAGINPFQLITRGQLCILVNGTINPFTQLKVEVNATGVGTGYVTIYDPTNAIYQAPAVVTSVDSAQLNTYIVAYQIPLAALSGGLSGFGRIRFTWMGGTGPLGTVTLCSMWSTISNAQANALYAVSYYNSASRSESPGVIVNQTSGNTLYNLIYGYNAIVGSPTTSGLLPLSQLLYYQTTVYANVFTITGTTASGTNQGVNQMNVYRQQVGEVQYSYIGVGACATYNAGITSWQISPAGSQTIVFSDGGTNNSVTENAARVYPNAYTICLPKGYVMTYSGSRLYVGGNSQVFVSDYLQPFRFRGQVTFLNSTTADPSSGTLNTFPGEQVTALVKASGSYIGVDTILAFTNKSMYRLDGQNAQTLSRPTREVEKGTLQPWSVVSYRGLVYWIDQDRIVQEWNGASPTPISRYKIDDKLWNGNLSLTSMAVQNERLYLAYQPSGGSAQTNVLVYEESLKEWCEDVMTGAVTIAQLLTINDLSFRKVYFLDNGGHLYQYEQLGATQDYGNPITVSFTTRRFQSDGWNYLDSQRVGVVCDGQGSGSLTVARSAFGAALGFNTNGTINIAYPASIVYAYEHTSSGVLPGGTSQGLQLTISGSVSGSWNLYYAGVNLSPNATSGAVDGS